MNSVFSNRMKFECGQPVSPLKPGTWPGGHNGTFYWMLKKTFMLDKVPENISMQIAADRHYEIYINSKRVASRRNYFNGDKYILLQKYNDMNNVLVKGENLIEILIRTDAFKNKNYIYFHPFAWLVMEMIYPGNKKYVATDSTWELAIIEDWRTLRTLAITTTHEITKLNPASMSGIMGTPGNLRFTSPFVLPQPSLPAFYEWTEVPKRKDTHVPIAVISSGTWETQAESAAFNISEIFTEKNGEAVLKASFESEENKKISISASGLCACRFSVNGKNITERNSLPGKDLMRQYNYLSPLSEINAERGTNILEFHFFPEQRDFLKLEKIYPDNPCIAGLWFRTIIHGIPPDSIQWQNGKGKKLTPRILKGELHDMTGSKAVNALLEKLKVSSPPSGFTLTGPGNQYVLFDFGKLKKGKLSFKIEAASSGKIYLAHGFFAERGSVDCARNGKKAVDVIEVAAGKSVYEAFEDRTFVYLDMLFENFSGKITVSEIKLEENIFLDEKDTSFKSSDKLMNGIFSASLRTAQLCCDEIYMDNPEREHAQWLDNTPPNMASGYYAFGGEFSKTGKVISEYAFNQREDGQLPGYAPGAWGERIPLQCHMALYFRAVWRDFQYRGNYEVLGNILPSMSRIISFWSKFRNTDGLLENIETIFGDWGIHIYSYAPLTREKSPVGIITAMNAYYLGALKMSAELNKLAGNEKLASEYLQMAETTTVSMKKYLFDDEKGLFRDGIKNKLAEKNYSQAANALCALYGVLPEKHGKAVLEKAFTKCRQWEDIIPASPHFCMQIGEALFETGLHETAYSWIRNGFGPMLDTPAGTLWETWGPYVSHCQGTGSAIVYLLSRYHCGIYPEGPAYAKIGIKPYDCGQKNLHAGLNTSIGPVNIEWQKTDSGFDYKLSLPSALHGREIIKAPGVKLSVKYK